jgi:regulator of protease activity HflC (stomatin/prohibitin superfamily)
MTEKSRHATLEREVRVPNGWVMLLVNVALFVGAVVLFVSALEGGADGSLSGDAIGFRVIAALLMFALAILACFGYFTLQPNEARVLVLFGSYRGSVRYSGFHWANPFYSRGQRQGSGLKMGLGSSRLSLRAHNFNSDKLKVNDKGGNPVEIAAVVVWRVEDTAQAAFDVEDYKSYVHVQSESAIRSIASLYAYDHGEEQEITLRGGGDEVALELKKELGARLTKAGVIVEEARLTHLAYAPEIASAMLRRQQAEAIIAARSKIVLGAVSMVEMALNELESKGVVHLDEEKKAAMVSNLLVVLCGTEEASPIINTGTLYS